MYDGKALHAASTRVSRPGDTGGNPRWFAKVPGHLDPTLYLVPHASSREASLALAPHSLCSREPHLPAPLNHSYGEILEPLLLPAPG